MSEAPKPVDEQPANPPVEPTAAAEPAPESKADDSTAPGPSEADPASEPVKDAVEPAPTTEATTAPAEAAAPKEEFTGEGFLGYKAPGGFIKLVAATSFYSCVPDYVDASSCYLS